MGHGLSHTMPVRVYYEDTDAGGVVYYANYLRFFERARTELFRALGFEQDALIREHDILFAVTNVEIKYHLPARFNDLLAVTATLKEAGRVGLKFQQEMKREADGELLSSAVIRVACLSASGFKPTPIPDEISEVMQQ